MSIAYLSVQTNFIIKPIISILMHALGSEGLSSSSASQRRCIFLFFSKGLNASRNATQTALFRRDFLFFFITHRDHDDGIIMMDRASWAR
jgi:hypothetical protein